MNHIKHYPAVRPLSCLMEYCLEATVAFVIDVIYLYAVVTLADETSSILY